ncbi:hypothetical protein RUND412_010154 [Rhizina undulata]
MPNSRILPPPIVTSNLPTIPTSHLSYRHQQSLPSEHYAFATGDSYFPGPHSNPSSIPSSTASTPAPSVSPQSGSASPQRRNTRSNAHKASISSLLSTSDSVSSGESSAASSPCAFWASAASSPTTLSNSSRSNSLVGTPLTGIPPITGPFADYELGRRNSSLPSEVVNEKVEVMGAAKRKSRSSSRANGGANGNTSDEYDVLGRKKPKTPRTPMSWDPQDDILLKQLKEEQRLGWKEIATHFPGRTSHACQFRWRRLASGTLKYYQGHRRPPVVTTTSSSFANEMATSASTGNVSSSPKMLMSAMSNLSPTPSTSPNTPQLQHCMPQYSAAAESPLRTLHPTFYQPTPQPTPWAHTANIQAMHTFQPTPLPSPPSSSPRFLPDESSDGWTHEEDALMIDKKLSFDEVNVLLTGRSEKDIWDRMVKLRTQLGPETFRRGSIDMVARYPAVDSGRILRSHIWDCR